jgi:hypothetical protein
MLRGDVEPYESLEKNCFGEGGTIKSTPAVMCCLTASMFPNSMAKPPPTMVVRDDEQNVRRRGRFFRLRESKEICRCRERKSKQENKNSFDFHHEKNI